MTQNEERSLLSYKKATRFLGYCHGYKFVSIHSKGALVALLLASLFDFEPVESEGKAIAKPYVQSIWYCLACLMFPVLGLYADVCFGRHKTLVALTIVRLFLCTIPLPLKLLDVIDDGSSIRFEMNGIVNTILQFTYNAVSVCLRIIVLTFGLDQLLMPPVQR